LATFKSSNDLRGEVRRAAGGLFDVRLWRGETEITVNETTADDNGLDFTATLNEEIPVTEPPLPADELAANLLTEEEKTTIHQKAEDDAKAAADNLAAEAEAEAEAGTKTAKKGK
jgi:hypothetical protein